jgi:hypothetical protein
MLAADQTVICLEKLTIQEQLARVIVRCNALKQRQSIAHAVGGRSCQLRWVEKRIDGDNFLQKSSHDS